MTNEIQRRKLFSTEKLLIVKDKLSKSITEALPSLGSDPAFSVYATGSFGRLEASEGSDLDTFIAGIPDDLAGDDGLSGLDQKIIIGRIIEVVRQSDLPDLDRDGEFIKYYTSNDLVTNIGLTADEVSNTFTARLLLLLESQPLFSQNAHTSVQKNAIDVYWRDFESYPNAFRPTFLLNDILKYWRLLCVDYESKMTQHHQNLSERRQERRVKNLKLRYNRMMTCFSTVAAICDQFAIDGSVSPKQALEICQSPPMKRLEKISSASKSNVIKNKVSEIENTYGYFLELSAQGRSKLIDKLRSDDEFAEQRRKADEFGQAFFELIQLRAGKTDLFRYLIV